MHKGVARSMLCEEKLRKFLPRVIEMSSGTDNARSECGLMNILQRTSKANEWQK